MVADDYHVIVYEILAYLYACLKKGVEPEIEAVDGYRKLHEINMRYWSYILVHLQMDGYVEGIAITPVMNVNWKTAHFTDGTAITPKGISYLAENSMMEKVKKFGVDGFKGVASSIATQFLGGI